jgi:hypothetical protein
MAAAQKANVTGVRMADLTYNGRPIPAELERDRSLPQYLVVGFNRHARKSGEQYRTIPAFAESRVYFTNFAAQAFSPAKRAKLEAWLDTDEGKTALPNGRPAQLVCVETLTADEQYWALGSKVLDWTPIQAIKVVRPAEVGGRGYSTRPTGSYELETGGHVEAGDIDLSVPLLYIRPNERIDPHAPNWNRPAKRTYPDNAIVLIMPANRLEKFRRDFPHASHWRDYVVKEATDWLDQQDAVLLNAAKYQISKQGEGLTSLDPARVDDPELADWIRLQQTPGTQDLRNGIAHRSAYLSGLDRYHLETQFPDPFKKYPLAHCASKHAEHTILYVNAAYAADRSN